MSPLGHVDMPCRATDETTAPVLDPGRGRTKTGYLWAVLRDDRGWNGTAPPGVVFHYRPGRTGEYAAEILHGFNGTIQVPLMVCLQTIAGQWTLTAPILTLPRQNARAAIHCGWPSAGHMGGAS